MQISVSFPRSILCDNCIPTFTKVIAIYFISKQQFSKFTADYDILVRTIYFDLNTQIHMNFVDA